MKGSQSLKYDIWTWEWWWARGPIKFRPKHQIKANLKRHLVMQEKITAKSIDAIMNTWGSHKAWGFESFMEVA